MDVSVTSFYEILNSGELGSLKPPARNLCQVTALQKSRQADIQVARHGVLRSQLVVGTRRGTQMRSDAMSRMWLATRESAVLR